MGGAVTVGTIKRFLCGGVIISEAGTMLGGQWKTNTNERNNIWQLNRINHRRSLRQHRRV